MRRLHLSLCLPLAVAGGQRLSLKAIAGSFTSNLLSLASLPPPSSPRPHLLAQGAGQQNPSGRVILLAGGIGITPFRPMLQQLLGVADERAAAAGSAPRRAAVTLVYSVRRLEEAVFLQELLQLATGQEGGHFQLVLLLTGGSVDSDAAAVELITQGLETSSSRVMVGCRIGSKVMHDVLGLQDGESLQHGCSVACMCGPEGFMRACGEVLGQLGLPSERLHQESFEY